MVATRTEAITAGDSDTFDGTAVIPDRGSVPGILLLQEIFGVNDFVTTRARDLAELGYVVLCPDVLWRVERNLRIEDPSKANVERAFALARRYYTEIDEAVRTDDLSRALDHLASMPEVTGAVATMGYCLGGTLAYALAAHGDATSVAAAVSYYGSGVPGLAENGVRPECPLLIHFGSEDSSIPPEGVAAVQQAFAERDDVTVVVHPGANHAFDNFTGPRHHPEAAKAAWDHTTRFLAEHLTLG